MDWGTKPTSILPLSRHLQGLLSEAALGFLFARLTSFVRSSKQVLPAFGRMMLTARNLWVLLIGSALMVAIFWFGAYQRDHRPELPPRLGVFPEITLSSADDVIIDRKVFDNHITALSFATMACADHCQTALAQLAKLQKLMKKNQAFQSLTIGVGFRGQFNLLRSMVQRIGIDTTYWHFAVETNGGDTLTKINQQFRSELGVQMKLSLVMVVDAAANIRGVYELTDKFAVVQLQNDIFNLLKAPIESITVSQRDEAR